jgi:hypothetical protein
MIALSLALGCALLTEADWDPDGDGVRILQDCDDTDPAIGKLTWYIDLDGDGFGTGAGIDQCEAPDDRYVLVGGDCDDARPEAFPEADELCNGVDDDCDDVVDNEAIPLDWYADEDEDGWGDPDDLVQSCDFVQGYTRDVGDCDDADAAVNPDGVEICNGIDDDCDELIDDDDEDVADQASWYLDEDGDDYGLDSTVLVQCFQPEGYAAVGGDCVDSDTAYNPGASETDCTDPNDYNCDGSTGYADADEDGWPACQECDDTDEDVNPDAVEVCNGVDDDCNGTIDGADSADAVEYYLDDDGDTYGLDDSTVLDCSLPSGYAEQGGDCDDGDEDINPSVVEQCDDADVDEDCDGLVDDEDTGASGKTLFYADSDGDGYGDPDTDDLRCDGTSAWLEDDSDCDDTDASINPDTVWYADDDGDGYGDAGDTQTQCEQPSGYLDNDDDCDDGEAEVSPDADEVCLDGVDNDCDGTVDSCDAIPAGDAGTGITSGSNNSRFGSQVTAGDVDGDGTDDLLVSDVYFSGGSSLRGNTYLFLGPISAGAVDEYSDADGSIRGDQAQIRCGKQAAVIPDWDGDGDNQVAVGCFYDDTGGNQAGGVYFFDGGAGAATTVASADGLVAGLTGSWAGHQTLYPGDINDDGVPDLVVGAREAGLDDEGAIFVMYGPLSSDIHIGPLEADVLISGQSADDNFGSSVARTGDLDGDGIDDLIVGASAADSGGSESGATGVWLGPLSGTNTPEVALAGEAADDNLGVLVAGPGDVDGDGYEDAMTCASENDDGGSNAGKCYLFSGGAGVSGWSTSSPTASVLGEDAGDSLGDFESLQGPADWDGDGTDELVLAARDASEDSGTTNGAVYIFMGPVSGSFTAHDSDLMLVGEDDDDRFGSSVTGLGDQDGDGVDELVVGARDAENGDGDENGAAYIFYAGEWF